MNKSASLYLDFVRFLAAVTVLIAHSSYTRFRGDWLSPISFLKHDAVIIFFVLSGFVIAYVANTRSQNYLDFALDRFARLWSVVIPALILTPFFDYLGMKIDPAQYSGYAYDLPIVRVISQLFFLSQIQLFSIAYFSNGPFWSINFEFWYYVFFTIFFFQKKYKFVFLTLVFLFAGLKIIVLFPIWILGCLVYYSKPQRLDWRIGLVLFISSFALYFIYHRYGIPLLLEPLTIGLFDGRLFWAQNFIADYILAIIIFFNFAGFISFSDKFDTILHRYEKFIRYCAGFTFSIYLLHFPLLNFFIALTDSYFLTVLATFISIFIVATFTEKKKYVCKSILLGLVQAILRYHTFLTRKIQ